MNRRPLISARGLALAAAMSLFFAAGIPGTVHGEEPWWYSFPSDPYPLTFCAVCDSILDAETEIIDFDEREIRICGSAQCISDFNDNSDTWIRVIDEHIARQQKPFYPLTTCVVDGEPIEGGAVEFIYFNRLFLLCSDACCAEVKKTPDKFFLQLNKAVIEKQKPGYPLTECIVSKQTLDENAVEYVVGNQLARLASEDQMAEFDAKAPEFLEELRKLTKEDAAAKGKE